MPVIALMSETGRLSGARGVRQRAADAAGSWRFGNFATTV